MADPLNFEGAKRRDRLTAENINRWIAASQRGIGRDVRTLQTPPTYTPPDSQSIRFPCINLSDETIPAGAPLSLESLLDETEAGVLNSRAFGVRLIEDATVSPVHGAVAVNSIPYEGGGECYVSGICVARLTADNESLIQSAGLTPIWDGSDEATRYALVRFGGASAAVEHLLLIGGNTLDSGQDGIIYSASVTPAAVYDPDVDTAYPDGLARGWLFIDGVRQAERVLIRHDFIGHTGAFLGGAQLNVVGTTTLSYGGTDMTAYTFGWP